MITGGARAIVARAVGALALSSASAVALAGEPLAWLQRMNAAVDGLNYSGTFVHLSGSESRTMQVVHRAATGERPVAERLLSLDGPEREVLRKGKVTRCTMPAERAVVVDAGGESPLRAALPDYEGGIEAHYDISFLGEERVAGRRTRRVAVQPRDRFRFGYQFWLDTATAMPLKTMTLGEGQRVVELMHFTDITFPDAIEDQSLAPTIASDHYATHYPSPTADHELGTQTAWTASRLPAGFRLSIATKELQAGEAEAEHLVYSDGLASVSVFIERGHGAPSRTRFAELGAASAFSRRVGAYQVVVIGEVPADTVTMIGRSIHLTSPDGAAANR
ncbi:MAG: MucB/RseB C-terminal domain-containing protein [Pseudomonadota bacterium]